MWEIKNSTPFAVEGSFERDRSGKEVWCVAVRARFNICDDGLLEISNKPSPVRLAPEYSQDALELLCDGDIAPFKECTDVLVGGSIRFNEDNITEKLITINIGSLRKNILILGKRTARVNNGLVKIIYEPLGTDPIDLSWRNSYGGAIHETAKLTNKCRMNPIGCGFSNVCYSDSPDETVIELPRFEDPHDRISKNKLPKCSIGFGPIQRFWEPRVNYAGTYDQKWKDNVSPLLPIDFETRFYQCAPDDQIYDGIIKGGEKFNILGINGFEANNLRLPQIIFEAKTKLSNQTIKTRFKCITLEIYPNEKTIELVWNTSVPCDGQDHLIKYSSVTIKQMAGVK